MSIHHPAIKHLELGPLGSPYSDVVAEGGLLVTKTLLITYLSKTDELGVKTPGSLLRAYHKANGELLAEVEVAQRLHGAPMTYLHAGRQYLAIAAGSSTADAELIAFALPAER